MCLFLLISVVKSAKNYMNFLFNFSTVYELKSINSINTVCRLLFKSKWVVFCTAEGTAYRPMVSINGGSKK